MAEDVSVFKKLADMFDVKPYTFKDVIDYVMKRINNAVEHQAFLDILIKGNRGVGKSTLALYIMYLYLQDSEEVLRNIFFDVLELNRALLKEKRKVILFDDAGVTLNKWRAMTNEAVDHYRLLQIPRTRVSVILYTCVSDSVAKFVRDTADIVISFHSRWGHKVEGTFYVVKEKYTKVVKKMYDFEMNLSELHKDPTFHNLYVEYNNRREKFITEVMRQILDKAEEGEGERKPRGKSEADDFIDEFLKKSGIEV